MKSHFVSFLLILLFLISAVDGKESSNAPVKSGEKSPRALNCVWQTTCSETVRLFEHLNSIPQDQWQNIILPAYSSLKTPKDVLWFRTQVSLPSLKRGERLFLCCDGIKFVTEIWLNGQSFGGYAGGSEPFELDITSATKTDAPDGKDTVFDATRKSSSIQTLVIRVEGPAAIAKKEPDLKKLKNGSRTAEAFENSVMWPVGSQGFSNIGIWEPIRLEVRKSARLDDLFIQTSVANKSIRVDGSIEVPSDSKKDLLLNARVLPWKGSKSVLDFDPIQLSLKKHITSEKNDSLSQINNKKHSKTISAKHDYISFQLAKSWENPRYWSSRDPYLYELEVKITDKATGELLQHHRERFGFREFTVSGDLLYLNGVPMRALGTAAHPRDILIQGESKPQTLALFKQLRKANINFMRLHANYWPKSVVETADEVGMPLILETPFFCWVRTYAINDPIFWKNFDVHVREFQKKHRNNPSFCMFSLCNEILHCGGSRIEPKTESYLAKAGLKAKKFDPTRPISYDGDIDPKPEENAPGVADLVNPHYPIDFSGKVDGCADLDWPNAAWWIDRGKVLACYPQKFYRWDRKKPLYFGEFLHIQHYVDSRNYSIVLGDLAAQGSFGQAMGQAKAKTWAMQIPAYRAAGVTGLCPWVITEPGPAPLVDDKPNPRYQIVKDSYEPVNIIMVPTDQYCFSNKSKTIEFYLINDTDAIRQLNLTVQLEQKGKISLKKQFEPVLLSPAGKKKMTVTFDLAKLACGKFTVQFDLSHQGSDGQKIDWSQTGKILPGEDHYFLRSGQITRSFDLIKTDPTQLTIKNGFRKIGFAGKLTASSRRLLDLLSVRQNSDLSKTKSELRIIDSLSKYDVLNDIDCLVIGQNRLTDLFDNKGKLTIGADGNAIDNLSKYLKKGGWVIVLEQTNYPKGLFPVELESRAISHYENDQYTRRWSCPNAFHLKPNDGAFEPLLRIGGPKGFEYAAVLRSERLILSQLPLENESAINPALLLDFAKILNESTQVSNKKDLFVLDKTGAIQNSLNQIGAKFTDLSNSKEKSSAPGLILINASAEKKEGSEKKKSENDNEVTAFRPAKDQTVILCGLDSKRIQYWAPILPQGLTLSEISAHPIRKDRNNVSNGSNNSNVSNNSNGSSDSKKKKGFQFFCGADSDLQWLGSRKDLPYRTMTPIQKIVDAAVVPFVADESRVNELPAIDLSRFKPSHSKAQLSKGVLSSSTKVILTAELDLTPGNYFLELDAHGSMLWNECSKVRILVDDRETGALELDPKFSKKRVPVVIRKSPCSLKIDYFNDRWDPETRADRNFWMRGARLIPAKKIDAFVSPFDPPICAKIGEQLVIDNVKWFNSDFPTPGASFYISDLLRRNGVRFNDSLKGLKIQGTKFTYSKKSKYRPVWNEPDVLGFGSNGKIAVRIDFGRDKEYRFNLRASGTAAQNVYPAIDLLIDGKRKGTYLLKSPARKNYVINTFIEKGEHLIELEFTNDLYIPSNTPDVPNQDRNAQIESFRVD